MRLLLLPLMAVLGACNMVISEAPVFGEADRATQSPSEGVWIGDDPECRFDPRVPESTWPDCALWVVVRDGGRNLLVSNRKGESQRVDALFVGGDPSIIQARWLDNAKKDATPIHVFYAYTPRDLDSDGHFRRAEVWAVECGVQEKPNSDIRPFPGITPECRPSSPDSVRSAARASSRSDEIKEWRWLRAETP